MQSLKLTLILALFLIPEPTPALKGDIVKTWARNLGEELWKLSEALTKSDQIRIKYKQMNASVKKKDGNQILESSLRSVATMLQRKINAVKCIHATAEELARNFDYTISQSENFTFEYCSAKYSQFSFQFPGDKPKYPDLELPKFVEENRHSYMNVTLEKDSHFYDISVNTNLSCVHVPTNIFYREKDALNAILWSRGLNDIFIKNYKSDPSLSWQYFGSAHGILRFYPGMPWNKQHVDTYDCRVQSWYIEAATCSKDVIILFDVSGSMTGFKNYVARRTLRSLLDTLSNNDYVNVFYFNNTIGEVVNCFKGLVQATKENIFTIRDVLEPTDNGKKHKYPLDGNANLTTAYIKAFQTLKARRNCDVTSTQGCNHLVMVITDYVPGNLTEVFEEHNREVVDGNTYIPVRVFTYLIGKEVTNVREIQWMACLNRGYFVHIHSVEEVQQQVLKYINVIARPMILEGGVPPVTWTHANIDNTRTEDWSVSSDIIIKKPDEDKLVTSVALPAFDYKSNDENNNTAMLLGVAGTDVPIDSIAKLAQPHQLGVNGYSFIVSNNGYLLLHPLLTTTINGVLQDNYNSVDFVEVEQVDDGKGPRELGDKIKQLRENLVNGSDGAMQGVEVLYHYDQMRRIARVKHDYYFNGLNETPFSMGISLPKEYGDTELLLKDNPLEAKQGKALTGINVTDYFRFSYRVHPDWVYCKYHYLEGHENDHPEHEIFKFLGNLSRNEINITKKQYAEESQSQNFSVSTHCGDATRQRDTDDYYCNEDLVKQLVFDAKLTTPYFENWHATEEEWELARQYNVSVRFVATSSGLTRWHYIFDPDKNERVLENGTRVKNFNGTVFGDQYITAIEETWYKAAVLQHSKNNTESLVIATRLPILDDMIEKKTKVENEDGDITITASYAIFYKDGESETPASVVGFEFLYSSFYEKFLQVTEAVQDRSEGISCKSSKYECYVIDSSGYVVLSKDKSQVGQFFGVINKYVLQSFVDQMIFDHVEVFNYQALCPLSLLPKESSAGSLLTPFTLAKNLLNWLVTEAIILMSNLYNWNDYAYAAVLVDEPDYADLIPPAHTEPSTTAAPPNDTKNANQKHKDVKNKPFSCDHRISLYILNQTYFLEAELMGAVPLISRDEGDCHPAYWATYITKTNLLLVVVENNDRTYSSDCKESPDTKPVATEKSTEKREPCHKLPLGNLPRRRLEGCYTYHENERNITACGIGSNVRSDSVIFIITTLLATTASRLLL